MSDFDSRGFTGRRTPEEFASRLPPGQYAERGFPVLTAGPTPQVGPRACSCPTSTAGRAPSGLRDFGSRTTTSPDSGRPTATTIVATPGRRSAIGPTDPG